MANLYGVANPLPYPGSVGIQGGNMNCPVGVETNVLDSGALIAASPGFYYPVVFVNMILTMGATPAPGIQIGVRIGAGADFSQWPVVFANVLGGQNIVTNGFVPGPISSTIWQGAGSHIFVTVNPTGQPVTAFAGGSYGQFWLYRAPDQ